MTAAPEIANRATKTPDQATIVPAPDLRLRVRRAELARILGVSRQAVAKAIQSGRISVDADGRVDPHRAVASWVRNTHPRSLRARLLRDAAALQQTSAEQARYWRSEAEAARRALAEHEASERERARAVRTAYLYTAEGAIATALPVLSDELARLVVAMAEKHPAPRLRRALDRGVISDIAHRRAWRGLLASLAEAFADKTEHGASPADPTPAADAPLFAHLEEMP